ncbi:MAG TPA: GNAT family N-acetyltransferase [Candidatus Omnitrophota bacterium]|nr:GNAT family N-acetyltransferase [Candidatus Omnitrophota bacterium]
MPPKGVTLRPITDADLPMLRDLYASTRAWEMSHSGWPIEQQQEFLTNQFSYQHQSYTTNYPGATLDVVERDGESVGRLYVHRTSEELRIIDICFFPQYCGQGMGGALLTELLSEADALGVPATIHVEKFNLGAKRLYQRLGFSLKEDRGVYELLAAGQGALRGAAE